MADGDSFFSDIVSRIFPKRKNANDPVFEHSEQLNRSAEFMNAFETWKSINHHKALGDEIKRNLRSAESEKSKWGISQYATPQASGLALHPADGSLLDDAKFLMELFRERMVRLGYRLQNASTRQQYNGEKLIQSDRYYLKPVVQYDPEIPMPQLYGNLTIELKLCDGRPVSLIVLASVYSGRMYEVALPFEELVDLILR